MPMIQADDGVRLYAESTGNGTPMLFIHEFAGDHRSWEPQVQYFSAALECITYSARGYPPSDVPADPAAYSQQRAVDDAISVLDALDVRRAHVVGLSMGGFTALHLAMQHPDRLLSAVVAGAGYGAQPEQQDQFRRECEATAAAFESEGAARVARRYAAGPALAIRAGHGARRDPRARAHHDRRRGRGLPGAGPDAQARHPRVRPERAAPDRPYR